MTAKTAIVLLNGQATPVNKTFTPLQSMNDMETWSDKSSGITIGQPVIAISIRRPQKNAASNRVRVSIAVPTLEVTSPSTGSGYQPVPKVAYTHLVNMDFVSPDRGTRTERQDIVAFAANILSKVAVTDAVLDAEMPY